MTRCFSSLIANFDSQPQKSLMSHDQQDEVEILSKKVFGEMIVQRSSGEDTALGKMIDEDETGKKGGEEVLSMKIDVPASNLGGGADLDIVFVTHKDGGDKIWQWVWRG